MMGLQLRHVQFIFLQFTEPEKGNKWAAFVHFNYDFKLNVLQFVSMKHLEVFMT